MAGAARVRPAVAMAATVGAALVAARARRRPKPALPSPDVVGGGSWIPGPALYGVGIRRNVEVRMSDSTLLRVNVHYPTLPGTAEPAPGPFPVLLMMTPYGKQAPGGKWAVQATGAVPYLVERGYIEVIADVRGTGTSGGAFELFGHAQVRDGVELVNWAAQLPESSGAVGMFGISYMGNNQLLTAAAAGPGSPLKAIFPIHAANDVYRELVTMGGIPHLPLVRSYKATFAALNIINPLAEALTSGLRKRPSPSRLARVRAQGRVQARYFTDLINDSLRDGDPAYDGELWERLRPASVLSKVVANGIPAFIVGGWDDCYQRGAPLNFAGLQNAWADRPVHAPMSPDQQVTGRYQLLMGSWYHMTSFPGVDLSRLQLRWFDHWLKGADTGIAEIPVRST